MSSMSPDVLLFSFWSLLFFLSPYCTFTLLFSSSVVSDSFVTPWTVAHQAPLSMEFSRQEYWSGLPCPPLGDLPDPGIELMSPALAGGFFITFTCSSIKMNRKASFKCRVLFISFIRLRTFSAVPCLLIVFFFF